MATAKQIAANRRNAQKSCGPTSIAGKQKVSQNRLVHALRGRFQVLEEVEKQEHYDALLNGLLKDEQPVGRAEIELVHKMAQHTWLALRALRMQENCFVPQPRTPEQIENGETPMGIVRDLESYVRYHGAHDRAYQRASKELRERRKEKLKAEIGFERQKLAQAEEIRRAEKHPVALAIANLKKQRLEMKFGQQLADALAHALPPNFDPSARNSAFPAAAPRRNPPISNTD